MAEELKINIAQLNEAAARIVLSAATAWGCSPEEAALRLLNELCEPKKAA